MTSLGGLWSIWGEQTQTNMQAQSRDLMKDPVIGWNCREIEFPGKGDRRTIPHLSFATYMVYFAGALYLKKTYQGGNAVFRYNTYSLTWILETSYYFCGGCNRKVQHGRKIVILQGWSYRCAPMARPMKSSYWSVAAPRISRSLVRKESGNNEWEVSLLIPLQPWEQNVCQLILERHSSWTLESPRRIKENVSRKTWNRYPPTVEALRIINGDRIMGAYGKAHHHKFKLSWQQLQMI